MISLKDVVTPPFGMKAVTHEELKALLERQYFLTTKGLKPYALLVVGVTGVGKTTVVMDACRSIAEQLNRPLVVDKPEKSTEAFVVRIYHLSRVMPDTIAGVPWPDGKVVRRLVPEELYYFSKEYEEEVGGRVTGCIFLDEFGQAPDRTTMNAVQQLLHDRRLEGIELADGVMVVGATNMWCKGDYEDLRELQDNVLARLKRVYLPPPDVKDWNTYAMKKGVHWTVPAFLELNPELIWCKSEGWIATPRSWESAGLEIAHVEEETGLDVDVFADIVATYNGLSIAKNFEQFLKLVAHVSLEEVLENPAEVLDLPKDVQIAIVYNACGLAKRDPSRLKQILKLVLTLLYGTANEGAWMKITEAIQRDKRFDNVLETIKKVSTDKAQTDLAIAMIKQLKNLVGDGKLRQAVNEMGALRKPLLYVNAFGVQLF